MPGDAAGNARNIAAVIGAYPRETQDMLFDAHAWAFAFFGGVPTHGIYDNMKTAVMSVFTGMERVFNRRFLVRRRSVRSPIRKIAPSFCLPPIDACFGTSPS